MITRTNVLTVLVLTAGAAAANAQTIPPYTIEARWQLVGSPSVGATIAAYVLQARAIFTGPFPEDTTGPSAARFGNFGVISMGYGPGGTTQPSTISITPSIGAAMQRGFWGQYHIEPDGGTPYDWSARGAAPGMQVAPGSEQFSGGFRNFGPGTTAMIDLPTGNSPAAADWANGRFNGPRLLTDFNLRRDDVISATPQPRIPAAPDGGPGWQDLYRVTVIEASGMVFEPSRIDATVTFDGWLRASGQSAHIGSSWLLASGELVRVSASFNIYTLPAPGAALPMLLLDIAAARRRAK